MVMPWAWVQSKDFVSKIPHNRKILITLHRTTSAQQFLDRCSRSDTADEISWNCCAERLLRLKRGRNGGVRLATFLVSDQTNPRQWRSGLVASDTLGPKVDGLQKAKERFAIMTTHVGLEF